MLFPVQFFNVLLAGLVVGVMFGVWQGYDPTLYSYNAFLETHQGAVRGLNLLIPIMGAATILLTLTATYLQRANRRVMVTLVAAAALFVASGLVTRFGNQPINAIVMNWNAETAPQDWTTLRDSWWMYHEIRLGLGMAALCLLLLGSLWSSPLRTAR